MMLQNQGQLRFHAANATGSENHTHTTAEALINLASAIVADRSAIANLTATNERLTGHIEKLSKQLATAMQKISSLGQADSQQICLPTTNAPNQNVLRIMREFTIN